MKRSGFTLIELGMVILVIGLLVAGVIAGREILGSSKVLQTISELSKYKGAFISFKQKYGSLPGDMSDASRHWDGAHDGNEDGYINGLTGLNSPVEEVFVWQHLARAHYIKGEYEPVEGDPVYVPGTSVPLAAIGLNGGYEIANFDASPNQFGDAPSSPEHYGEIALMLGQCKGTLTKCQTYTRGLLTTEEIYNIDKKLDDGSPTKGVIAAQSGADYSGSKCYDPGTDNYNLNNTGLNSVDRTPCRLLYFILR